MKTLQERHEIANALNFGRYPVLTMDLAKMEYNNGLFKSIYGCKVKFEDGRTAKLCAFSDEKKLTLSADMTCLSASFGYSDIMEMTENANAPIIRPDQDVVVCITDSSTRKAYAPIIVHTTKEYNRFCSTPMEFDEADVSWIFDVK